MLEIRINVSFTNDRLLFTETNNNNFIELVTPGGEELTIMLDDLKVAIGAFDAQRKYSHEHDKRCE